MPVVVACLVPSAPALLARLTGDRVPEVGPVRDAVAAGVASLSGVDRVLVVAPRVPGTLAGFGAPDGPSRPSPLGSWPHALAAELLDAASSPQQRTWLAWDEVVTGGLPPAVASDGRVGLLLLADGSRTRGPRAPGGDDPRGAVVDAGLVRALRDGRAPAVPDAEVVGATAVPAVRLLVDLVGHRSGAVEVLYADAPLGVGYLVAVARAEGAPGPAATDRPHPSGRAS